MPRRRLPPLNALRAFESAARHHSLSRAAQELGVTHGAISRQVAKLEQFLGTKLFERAHQHVLLTKRGAAYAARLQVLFDQIQEATASNFGQHADRAPLRIGVLPTFAMRFLIPRLAKFKRMFPEQEIEIETYASPRPNDPEVEVDVAVWRGHGRWPNLVSQPLFAEELQPVASPALIAGRKLVRPDDLEPFLLLHALRRPDDWKIWLDAAGATKVDPHRGLKLEYSGLVYQGAADGLGLAMAQTKFVHEDLALGRLVPVFDLKVKSGPSYFVVYSEIAAGQARIVKFVQWLKAEVAVLDRAEVRALA